MIIVVARRRGYQWLVPVWNYLLITGGVGQAEGSVGRVTWPLQSDIKIGQLASSASERRRVAARLASSSNLRREDAAVARSSSSLAQLGAVSSNKHEARVNIDVEPFFIARNGRLIPRF